MTVGDYLEKIFQIPIWMSPIRSEQRAAVVKSLLGVTAAPEPKGGAARAELRPAAPGAAGAEEEQGQRPVVNAFASLVARAAETPDPLRITLDESTFVDRVAPLLSDKPRALKRFVNTYRLLKASLSDVESQSFVRSGAASPHKVCLSQLALFTGQPRLAPAVVRELGRTGRSAGTLKEWLATLPEAERAAIAGAVTQIPDHASIPLRDFRQWLPATSKYLFHRDD